MHLAGLGGSDGNGNWTCPVRDGGECTLAIVDHLVLRPRVIVSRDPFNRVDMILSFTYDIKGDAVSGSHREIGQTFVSSGYHIILVGASAPAGTILTLPQGGRSPGQAARFAASDIK